MRTYIISCLVVYFLSVVLGWGQTKRTVETPIAPYHYAVTLEPLDVIDAKTVEIAPTKPVKPVNPTIIEVVEYLRAALVSKSSVDITTTLRVMFATKTDTQIEAILKELIREKSDVKVSTSLSQAIINSFTPEIKAILYTEKDAVLSIDDMMAIIARHSVAWGTTAYWLIKTMETEDNEDNKQKILNILRKMWTDDLSRDFNEDNDEL